MAAAEKHAACIRRTRSLSDTILVPFCPQSQLSGVNHKDFLYGVWYRRTVDLTKAQLSGRVVLHFGAVDYHCEAFVNGVSVGNPHRRLCFLLL